MLNLLMPLRIFPKSYYSTQYRRETVPKKLKEEKEKCKFLKRKLQH